MRVIVALSVGRGFGGWSESVCGSDGETDAVAEPSDARFSAMFRNKSLSIRAPHHNFRPYRPSLSDSI
jgi:hypothetical protein